MTFDNVRFPTSISRGSTGGPERRTDVVATASGREERNARWANSRRHYHAGYGMKSLDDIHALVAFFEERRGKLHSFRWKDFADYKSCAPSAQIAATDQVIGTGDGSTRVFQLVKRYGSGIRDYQRKVTAPVAGSAVIAVAGVISTQVTVDVLTGLVTFTVAPASGAVVSAGFEFDVPVRFDTDAISINLAHFAGGDIPDVPLIEVQA